MNEPTNEPLDLAAVEARLAAALPGPYYDVIGWDDGLNVYIKDGNDGHIADDSQREIFIHAPVDIAALVKEVYRLREKVADLKDELNDCNNNRQE